MHSPRCQWDPFARYVSGLQELGATGRLAISQHMLGAAGQAAQGLLLLAAIFMLKSRIFAREYQYLLWTNCFALQFALPATCFCGSVAHLSSAASACVESRDAKGVGFL